MQFDLHVSDCLAEAQIQRQRQRLIIEIDSGKMNFVTFMLINCVCDRPLKLKRQQINVKFQLSKHKQNNATQANTQGNVKKLSRKHEQRPQLPWPIFEASCLWSCVFNKQYRTINPKLKLKHTPRAIQWLLSCKNQKTFPHCPSASNSRL